MPKDASIGLSPLTQKADPALLALPPPPRVTMRLAQGPQQPSPAPPPAAVKAIGSRTMILSPMEIDYWRTRTVEEAEADAAYREIIASLG